MLTNQLPATPTSKKVVWKKDRQPSASMLSPDGKSYRCVWLEDSLTILSDGNVTCGLDDPHAARSFGNVFSQSIAEIFANPEIERIRVGLSNGRRCDNCWLYTEQETNEALSVRPLLPHVLVIEPTVTCNLRCPNTACDPNNDKTLATRERDKLELNTFVKVIDETAPYLKELYFFNYGDPFINPDAESMLKYVRSASSSVRIVSSTNGIPLKSAKRARAAAAADVDQMTFTISGAYQDSYEKYHVNGRLDAALQGLEHYSQARIGPSRGGRAVVTWRYLVFRWNDSEDELDHACHLAGKYGVDQLSFYLTHMPAGAASYRLAPGTPLFHKYKQFIDAAHGFQVPIPQPDGMWPVETLTGFGPLRWSGWSAEVEVCTIGGWALISLATNRLKDNQFCFIVHDGITHKVPLDNRQWTHLSFPSARADYEISFINIVAAECWFPVDEGNSEDLRCLGVMVSSAALGGHQYRDQNTWEWLKRLPGPSLAELEIVKAGMECRRDLTDRHTAGRVLF